MFKMRPNDSKYDIIIIGLYPKIEVWIFFKKSPGFFLKTRTLKKNNEKAKKIY